MSKKTQQYNLDEAMSCVLELGSKSEMSELEDSCDEDYEPEIIDRNGYNEEEEENEKESEELPENENKQEIKQLPEEEREKENRSQKASKTKKSKRKKYISIANKGACCI